jgi:hypothetical protein
MFCFRKSRKETFYISKKDLVKQIRFYLKFNYY